MNYQNFDTEQYREKRYQMVKLQIEGRGIKDERVLEAMRRIPRHLFVPEDLRDRAYEDGPLPIGEGQTISQPYIVALMTEALELKGDEKVLEIGTGSGYQTAILCALAHYVFTVERKESLAIRAMEVLRKLNFSNLKLKIGDGTLGWEEFSPYDGIIVTAGAPSIPKSLITQLKVRGRLVIPVGPVFAQELIKVEKLESGKLKEYNLGGCAFVKLVGAEGWEEEN